MRIIIQLFVFCMCCLSLKAQQLSGLITKAYKAVYLNEACAADEASIRITCCLM